MANRFNHSPSLKIEPAEKILKAALNAWNNEPEKPGGRAGRAFVTVCRQPGAGAISFSHRLAEHLNQNSARDWSAWDRELVEKVSAEHGIAKEIIESIPNRRHHWLDELLQNLSLSQAPADVMEPRAYQRVAMTIRALATAGHAIIVGEGGVFITRDLPGGIHLRLVAPLEQRIQYTAQRDNLSSEKAAAQIAEIDCGRSEFYRRYWPGKAIAPETFTMMLNSAAMSVDELVQCVLPLIRLREACEDQSRGAKPRKLNGSYKLAPSPA